MKYLTPLITMILLNGCYPVESDTPPHIEAQMEQSVAEDIASGRYDQEANSTTP